MTPQEKAKELVLKFIDAIPCNQANDIYTFIEIDKRHAKECALICVDEILSTCVESMIYYWQQVKTEIEKL